MAYQRSTELNVLKSLNIIFVLTNSEDPDEMSHFIGLDKQKISA